MTGKCVVSGKTLMRHKPNQVKQFRIGLMCIHQRIAQSSCSQQFQIKSCVDLIGVFSFDGFALFGEPQFAAQ